MSEFSNSPLFELRGSIDAEMREFQQIREENPELAKKIFTTGQNLVTLAGNGSYRKFVVEVQQAYLQKVKILAYFIVQTLKAALLNSHLMIATFIIDNGYPINNTNLPCIFHDSINEVNDYLGKQIVEFLVQRKYDINTQAPKTWLTLLHIAIKREMLETVSYLLENGADVNAVADGDVMPLHVARNLTDTSRRKEIIELLESRGARDTWKKNKVSFSGGGNPSQSSTYISFKGGDVFVQFAGSSSTIQPTPLAPVPESQLEPEPQVDDTAESKTAMATSDDGGMMFSVY